MYLASVGSVFVPCESVGLGHFHLFSSGSDNGGDGVLAAAFPAMLTGCILLLEREGGNYTLK